MSNSNQWMIGGGTDDQFAWIENGNGHNVVCIERLAGKNADGGLKFAGPSVHRHDALEHATTDTEWQGMIDLIAAAPEMLDLLRDLRREISDGSILDAGNIENYGREIEAVLAKADPNRLVKVRVTFEVDVVPSDTELHTFARARDEVLVCGSGKCVEQKIVYPTPTW